MAVTAEAGGGPPPVEIDGCTWERTMVHTHLIHIKEPLEPLLDSHVRPLLQKGDFVAMSEKVVAISEGRVVHESVVRPGLLAKLIVKGTKKYEHDVAYSDPRKMQVAIMQTGSVRAAFAMVVGGVTKLFGRHGDFYRIAGHRIAEIDGFNPQVASRLLSAFESWRILEPGRRALAEAALKRVLAKKDLSRDSFEIATKIVGEESGKVAA